MNAFDNSRTTVTPTRSIMDLAAGAKALVPVKSRLETL
jgi:hypothetical protein